jgi:hypothetical protein
LKPGPGETEGRIVAVKVQKPAIKKQMELDLFSYRYVNPSLRWENSAEGQIVDVARRETLWYAQWVDQNNEIDR